LGDRERDPLEKPKRGWDNIKMDIQEVVWGGILGSGDNGDILGELKKYNYKKRRRERGTKGSGKCERSRETE
jgi:hypothetical protein